MDFAPLHNPIVCIYSYRFRKEVKQMKSLDQVLDKNINLKDISLVQNSYMYDRDGSLVSEIVSDHENRVLVPFDKIPRKSNRFS